MTLVSSISLLNEVNSTPPKSDFDTMLENEFIIFEYKLSAVYFNISAHRSDVCDLIVLSSERSTKYALQTGIRRFIFLTA